MKTQTITYENYADGYFQLFRGGAEIVEVDGKKEIQGFCPYGRLIKSKKSKGLYIRPHLPGEYVYNNRLNGQKYMLKTFMKLDDVQIEQILNTHGAVISADVSLKCVFTDRGEIFLYDANKTKDPKPVSKICKTECNFLKAWGYSLTFYSDKMTHPDGIPVRGWKFEKNAEYIICDTFHGVVEDYKHHLIPELYNKGNLLEKFSDRNTEKMMSGEWYRELCSALYDLGAIDLSSSWDYTDEEKEQMKFEAEERIRKEIEYQEELERRKRTPGYCSICGAEHAEFIPFVDEWRCRDCFRDMFE